MYTTNLGSNSYIHCHLLALDQRSRGGFAMPKVASTKKVEKVEKVSKFE